MTFGCTKEKHDERCYKNGGSAWCGYEYKERKKKEHEDKDHKCSVGCPKYNSGHSIDANGNCNKGCC